LEIKMDDEKIFKITPSGVDYALKCKRCQKELINRITDIIDVYMTKLPPNYNPGCSNCKFVVSLKQEKYV
tara:strand:+ start:389 stop:598 length:210 start_codon:yes stop_codon:yes gene_type:complete